MRERKEWRENHRFGEKMMSLVSDSLSFRAGIQERSGLKVQSSGHWHRNESSHCA